MTVNLPHRAWGQSPRCGVTWLRELGENKVTAGTGCSFGGSALIGSFLTTRRTGIHMLTKLGVHFLQVAQAPTSCLCFTSVKLISKCEK